MGSDAVRQRRVPSLDPGHRRIRQVCVEDLRARVDLQIVGVADQPDSSMRTTLVVRDRILAGPTLVKRLPLPLRRLAGDFSKITCVPVGLDLESLDPEPEPEPEHTTWRNR